MNSIDFLIGTGHFSPIGGYHPSKDLALIMDVARFKYPPHWVPVPLLYEAMKPLDENTQKERGYMVITNGGQLSTFCRIKAGTKEWEHIAQELWQKLPSVISAAQPTTLFQLIEAFFTVLQDDKTNKQSFISFFGTYIKMRFTVLTVS
jgi:glutathione gamma-glutamylcysteinyltransferase